MAGFEPATSSLPRKCSTPELRRLVLSGRRGSNPRPSAWKADALSTELLPLKTNINSNESGNSPINLKVKDIVIINDKVKAYDGNNQFGEYDYVKGIIVKFEGFEYLFHRSIWFSDDIIVDRGTETVERLSPIDEDWGDWSKPRHSVNTREFISLINQDN